MRLQRLPFGTISVLDGRLYQTDEVGTYETRKKTDFRYTIPLRMDTTPVAAMERYLNRWYVSGTGDQALCVYLRKYVLFDGKVALGADVYLEKNGRYYQILREDTTFRRDWKYYISGGALDVLMERVRAMGGQSGHEVSLNEIEQRRDGLDWNLHADAAINGVYPSIHDFLMAKPQAVSGKVDTITGRDYSWRPRVPKVSMSRIPQGDTIYTITFPRESLKKHRWLRRWQRQPLAIASQNGALYLRFKKGAFLKLTKEGSTFVANPSPSLIWAYLRTVLVFQSGLVLGSDTSYDVYYPSTPVGSGFSGALLGQVGRETMESKATQAGLLARYSANSDRHGWHYYVDMDLQTVICY
ncbi:hypothetical protein [Dinghuibacter silviterrae]|uniref:hypothetical protein n=1 Tax=Dinghuibacter silviterrae TaxID=1539049 RepID=UPI00106272D2|nr:hypothetical protein [Dinghuibacter silviterrae]